MTVTEMDTYLKRILGDPDSHQWTQATHRLPALNNAQNEFVIRVLGYGAQTDTAYDILSELQRSDAVTVDVTGVDLDTLDTDYDFIRNGYVASRTLVERKYKWVTRRQITKLAEVNNKWLQGNNVDPKCYVLNNTYYLEIDTGYYPAVTDIYWVRKPYELVVSGAGTKQTTTCEINPLYHYLICRIAAEECHRMIGDEQNATKYLALNKENTERIQEIVMGSTGEPKESGKK